MFILNKYYLYKQDLWNFLLIKKIFYNIFYYSFLIIEIILIFLNKILGEYKDFLELNYYIFSNSKILLEKNIYINLYINKGLKNVNSQLLLDITKKSMYYCYDLTLNSTIATNTSQLNKPIFQYEYLVGDIMNTVYIKYDYFNNNR